MIVSLFPVNAIWVNSYDGKPLIDLLDATIDWMIDDDGSRWIVIDTEYLRQHVAHYALLSADTWRQRLLDAGVEVD